MNKNIYINVLPPKLSFGTFMMLNNELCDSRIRTFLQSNKLEGPFTETSF